MPLWHPHKQVKSIKPHPCPVIPRLDLNLGGDQENFTGGKRPLPVIPQPDRSGVENFASGKRPFPIIPRLGRAGVQKNFVGGNHPSPSFPGSAAVVSKKILAGGHPLFRHSPARPGNPCGIAATCGG